MIPIQETKICILTPPQLKDNGAFAGNTYLDTQGWNHLRVLFIVGTLDETIGSTGAAVAPKVEECDTTDGTYTDVTDAALADAIAATEDDSLFAIDIDLTRSHKRYMEVDPPTAGDGTTGCNLAIIGILSRPEVGPVTAAQMGLAELIKA
jgi:hypothetical protein